MMFKTLFAVLLISAIASAEITTLSEAVVKDLAGNDVSLEKFKDKCVLVINTASGCGFTKPNMKYLNELTERHPDLAILAFPSNSFGQEPKSNDELNDWFFNEWKAKYNVFAPVDVKESEIYQFFIKQAGGKAVIWNYGKYLIQKDGTSMERYGPQAGAVPIVRGSLDKDIKKCLEN